MRWHELAIQRLQRSAHSDGGWGYQSRLAPAAEPTALACLALADHEDDDDASRGLRWLAHRQQDDGAVPATSFAQHPCWPTGLAVLAWVHSAGEARVAFQANIERGSRWLLQTEGKPFKSNPAIYGHDTRLIGWPWVDGTHSWIEPSAYAVLALRSAGHAVDVRIQQATALFRDRAMSPGGWNYGNSRMFGSDLRPFPAQTGMVLAALAGQPRADCITKALEFLHAELPRVRAPVTLAWGLIGLAAWNEKPADADAWLEECADRVAQAPAQPVFDALLLLARSSQSPFNLTNKELAGGV